jgi:hypothetical protein
VKRKQLGNVVAYRASHSDERLLGSCDTSRFNRYGKGTNDVTAELDRNADSLFQVNKFNNYMHGSVSIVNICRKQYHDKIDEGNCLWKVDVPGWTWNAGQKSPTHHLAACRMFCEGSNKRHRSQNHQVYQLNRETAAESKCLFFFTTGKTRPLSLKQMPWNSFFFFYLYICLHTVNC